MLVVLLIAVLLAASPARADETCMSPYMPKITGQEDYVYVWTLGVDGVGDLRLQVLRLAPRHAVQAENPDEPIAVQRVRPQ